MFEPNPHRQHGRNHHRDPRRNMRDEIRRNMRRNSANVPFSLRDLFGRGRSGTTVRRGEIRPLIIAVLRDRPMHGYEVIQELEARSGGRWRPSAGSVYPTLQQLADEDLVTSEEVDGRRTYTLTDKGQAAAAASTTRAPWTEAESDTEPDIRQLAMQLAQAVIQVHRMGSPRARREARPILADARRQMWRLLADDEEEAADDDGPNPG